MKVMCEDKTDLASEWLHSKRSSRSLGNSKGFEENPDPQVMIWFQELFLLCTCILSTCDWRPEPRSSITATFSSEKGNAKVRVQ